MDGVGYALANKLKSLGKGKWEMTALVPTGRPNAIGGSYDNYGYVFGGDEAASQRNVNERYDPTTNTWTTKAVVPAQRSNGSSATVNGLIYVYGQQDKYNYAYDPITNTWSSKADQPFIRYSTQPFVLNNKIYVTGGIIFNSSWVTTNTTYEYDPLLNAWTAKASISEAKANCSTFALNGYGYIAGGTGTSDTNVTEKFDPVNNTWTIVAPMIYRTVYGKALVLKNKPYIFNGQKRLDTTGINFDSGLIETYDDSLNKWSVVDATPACDHRFTLFSIGDIGYLAFIVSTSTPGGNEVLKYTPPDLNISSELNTLLAYLAIK